MPRRRKVNVFNVQEITSLVYLVIALPIIIVGCVVIYLISYFANWLNTTLGIPSEITFVLAMIPIVIVVVGTPVLFIILYTRGIQRKYESIKLAGVDVMTGVDFEHYLKALLIFKGYSVNMTDATGDLGVDLVASKNDERIAIQAKRYTEKVSRRAVSDAVAGKNYYGCNKAMVITNSYFSPGAIELASSNGCVLIDRDMLAKWIDEFQNSRSHINSLSTEIQ